MQRCAAVGVANVNVRTAFIDQSANGNGVLGSNSVVQGGLELRVERALVDEEGIVVEGFRLSVCLCDLQTLPFSITFTHTLSLSLSLSLTHTHTHTLSLSLSRTRTHTHTHTCSLSLSLSLTLSLSISLSLSHTLSRFLSSLTHTTHTYTISFQNTRSDTPTSPWLSCTLASQVGWSSMFSIVI